MGNFIAVNLIEKAVSDIGIDFVSLDGIRNLYRAKARKVRRRVDIWKKTIRGMDIRMK